MNIGIDLDDTINNLADEFLKYAVKYNREENINYAIKPNKWEFEESFGWNSHQADQFFNKYIEIMIREVTVKKHVKEVLERLSKENYSIIIITARSTVHCKRIYEISLEWLNKHGLKFDKLVINGSDKAQKCLENNIDIFIDDRNLPLRKCI